MMNRNRAVAAIGATFHADSRIPCPVPRVPCVFPCGSPPHRQQNAAVALVGAPLVGALLEGRHEACPYGRLVCGSADLRF